MIETIYKYIFFIHQKNQQLKEIFIKLVNKHKAI